MNDEIKEILEKLKDNIPIEEYRSEGTSDGLTHYEEDKDSWQYKLLDYITNLQNENMKYDQCLTELTDNYKDMQKDLTNLQQENERLKDIVVEKDNQIKEMILQKTDYTDVNILEMKLEDYKSRCEKASECIKKDTRWFDSEYASIYGELCDYAGAKGDRLEVMVNPSNALNILQNGREENE